MQSRMYALSELMIVLYMHVSRMEAIGGGHPEPLTFFCGRQYPPAGLY